MTVSNVDKRLLMPVLAGFFIMGFCDIVAPITDCISDERPEMRHIVSFLPTMVFLWFLLLSVPVAGLMNRIGRKSTAMLGYAFTIVGLLVPYAAGADCALWWYFAGFGLLGVGNTIVQVAVNPLLATIVPSERMTSFLTVGQIFRNTSLLLLAPLVAGLIAYTGSWRLVLPIYAGLTVLGGIWLQLTTVPESERKHRASGFIDCFRLLKNPVVLICALGIAAFIAADVGVGFVSVQLTESSNSILVISGFYACRIIGTLIGAWVLTRYSDVKYLYRNLLGALICASWLIYTNDETVIYILLGLLGFCMACVFATFYAVATKAEPDHANEIAGLMILAISAGAVSGPVCNALIHWAGYVGAGMFFVVACLLYMFFATGYLISKNKR